DDEDAMKNIPVGRFRVDGLRAVDEENEVLCRMSLDLDGILHVTAIEKATGKSKHITIRNAFAAKSSTEIEAARQRLSEFWQSRELDFSFARQEGEAEEDAEEIEEGGEAEAEEEKAELIPETSAELSGRAEADKLMERSRGLLGKIHPDDVEEIISL